MKILITGALGQLGRCLTDNIDALHNDSITYDAYSKNELSITDYDAINNIIDNGNYDYVINCAAYTNVPGCEDNIDLSMSINAYAVNNLGEVCARNNVRLIHISTDYVYCNCATLIDETTMPKPLNAYGVHKLAGESLLHVNKNLEYAIIRTSWLYSKYCKNFMNTIIRKIDNNEVINVVDDQIGSPTNANDLARFIIKMMTSDVFESGIYNYSNDGAVSWYTFASMIAYLYCNGYDKLHPCSTADYPTTVIRPSMCIMSKEKVKRIYGDDAVRNWVIALNDVLNR